MGHGVGSEHRELLIFPFYFFISTMFSLWDFSSSVIPMAASLTGLLLGAFTAVMELPRWGHCCALCQAVLFSEIGFSFLSFSLSPPLLSLQELCSLFQHWRHLMQLRTFYGQYFSELLEQILPLSFPILPMPSLYRLTWILAFLKQKGEPVLPALSSEMMIQKLNHHLTTFSLFDFVLFF